MIEASRRVLFFPSRAAFEQIDARANLGRAIIFAAGAGLVLGVSGGVINLFFADEAIGNIVPLAIFNAIRLVVALLATQGLIYELARVTGAHGAFERQAYLGALFNVPLNFVAAFASGFNSLLPGAGIAIGAAILSYQILLTIPLLRAVHGNEWRAPAWWVVLIALVGNTAGVAISAVLPQ